jgi:hypothetical protein
MSWVEHPNYVLAENLHNATHFENFNLTALKRTLCSILGIILFIKRFQPVGRQRIPESRWSV